MKPDLQIRKDVQKSRRRKEEKENERKNEHYENRAVSELLVISSPIFCSRAFTKVTDVG